MCSRCSSQAIKRRLEWRKGFGEDRKAFNNSVWGTLLKSRTFSFHHEITTDGVAVSLLYSRVSARGDKEHPHNSEEETSSSFLEDANDGSMPPGGLDPGKKNILTMADGDGNVLRYTACQRNFESKLTRYRKVLSEERDKHHMTELKMYLSQFSGVERATTP